MARKTILHVNRHNIAQNVATDKRHEDGELLGSQYQGELKPVFTAKDYKSNRKGQSGEIRVDGRVIGRLRSEWAGDGQLSCGARVWLEFYEGDGVEVVIDGADS